MAYEINNDAKEIEAKLEGFSINDIRMILQASEAVRLVRFDEWFSIHITNGTARR